MPIEEYRYVYFGKTSKHINVYLGKDSANFAKFLYEKANIDFEVEKTDVLLSVSDYSYLVNLQGTTFQNNTNSKQIADEIKTLMDAFDIAQRRNFKLVSSSPILPLSNTISPQGVDYLLYNKNEGITLFVPECQIPENKDCIFTCMEWSSVAQFYPQELQCICDTGDKIVDVLCKLFHKKHHNRLQVYDKVNAFKELYCVDIVTRNDNIIQ
jgi:hypothetical protein